jgi:hypothetical protein
MKRVLKRFAVVVLVLVLLGVLAFAIDEIPIADPRPGGLAIGLLHESGAPRDEPYDLAPPTYPAVSGFAVEGHWESASLFSGKYAQRRFVGVVLPIWFCCVLFLAIIIAIAVWIFRKPRPGIDGL